MDVRRTISWTTVALGLALVCGGPSPAGAQNPNPGAPVAEPYTPAKDAKT